MMLSEKVIELEKRVAALEAKKRKPAVSKSVKIEYDDVKVCWYNIEDAEVERWQTRYPGINIDRELDAAAEWQHAHPTRQKENNRAYLVNWFKRAQDKGGR